MKMFLTRLGFNSKAVITGDVTQIDLPTGKKSGLVEALEVCGKIDGIGTIQFGEKDVVRHNLVQQIIRAYEEWDVAHPAYPNRNSGTNAANGRGDRRVPEVAKELVSEQIREPGRVPDEPAGQDVK
jgi:phosphate starvation-inducible PhoH-like protein